MRLLKNTLGATAAEYALILGIVGAAIAIASLSLGNAISGSMNASKALIQNCGGGC